MVGLSQRVDEFFEWNAVSFDAAYRYPDRLLQLYGKRIIASHSHLLDTSNEYKYCVLFQSNRFRKICESELADNNLQVAGSA